MIDQQERTEAGASGDDLGAPFSLSALCEERTYSPPPLAGGGMACGHRAPSGGRGRNGSAISFPLPVYTADANGGLCIGCRCVDALGAWGPSATNKLRRVYTGALLAITIGAYKKA